MDRMKIIDPDCPLNDRFVYKTRTVATTSNDSFLGNSNGNSYGNSSNLIYPDSDSYSDCTRYLLSISKAPSTKSSETSITSLSTEEDSIINHDDDDMIQFLVYSSTEHWEFLLSWSLFIFCLGMTFCTAMVCTHIRIQDAMRRRRERKRRKKRSRRHSLHSNASNSASSGSSNHCSNSNGRSDLVHSDEDDDDNDSDRGIRGFEENQPGLPGVPGVVTKTPTKQWTVGEDTITITRPRLASDQEPKREHSRSRSRSSITNISRISRRNPSKPNRRRTKSHALIDMSSDRNHTERSQRWKRRTKSNGFGGYNGYNQVMQTDHEDEDHELKQSEFSHGAAHKGISHKLFQNHNVNGITRGNPLEHLDLHETDNESVEISKSFQSHHLPPVLSRQLSNEKIVTVHVHHHYGKGGVQRSSMDESITNMTNPVMTPLAPFGKGLGSHLDVDHGMNHGMDHGIDHAERSPLNYPDLPEEDDLFAASIANTPTPSRAVTQPPITPFSKFVRQKTEDHIQYESEHSVNMMHGNGMNPLSPGSVVNGNPMSPFRVMSEEQKMNNPLSPHNALSPNPLLSPNTLHLPKGALPVTLPPTEPSRSQREGCSSTKQQQTTAIRKSIASQPGLVCTRALNWNAAN